MCTGLCHTRNVVQHENMVHDYELGLTRTESAVKKTNLLSEYDGQREELMI